MFFVVHLIVTELPANGSMRCDLHVHTTHSGYCTIPVAKRFCQECYNEPLAVYQRLKQLGMNLVTVTDHDSIGAIEELGRFNDFFSSVEISIEMPGGTEAHVSVYGLDERQHIETQRRRNDIASLLAYLDEHRLLFGINHVFSGLTGRRELSDFDWFERHFPLWETRNGAMLPAANRAASAIAASLGKGATGGSDSHTMHSLASAFTEVPGARNREEFLDGLRAGQGVVLGTEGDGTRVVRDVFSIAMSLAKTQPWTIPLMPALLGLPVVALVNFLKETRFAAVWSHRLAQSRETTAAAAIA
jgi:predicted metal-dependent phosphoesterase TrpH